MGSSSAPRRSIVSGSTVRRLVMAFGVALAVALPFLLSALDPLGRSPVSGTRPVALGSVDEETRGEATSEGSRDMGSPAPAPLPEGPLEEPVHDAASADRRSPASEASAALVSGGEKDLLARDHDSPIEAVLPLSSTEDVWSRWVPRPGPGPRCYGSCSGTILDEAGEPLVGEPVWLWGEPSVPALTDGSGRFLIAEDWVDPAGRALMIGARGGALVGEDVLLVPDAETELTAVIARGFEVVLRIEGGDPPEPIAGALIQLLLPGPPEPEEGIYPMRGWSDRQGTVRFPNAAERYYTLFIVAEGWRTERSSLNLATGSRPRSPIAIRLQRAQALEVRIEGWPPGRTGRARVLLRDDSTGRQVFQEGSVSAVGAYVGTAPEPGVYSGWIESEGWRASIADLVVEVGARAVARVERPSGASVSGVVRDVEGRPVEGEVRGRGVGSAPIAPDGSFCLHPVEPGEQVLTLVLPDQRIHSLIRVEVAEEGLEDLLVELPTGAAHGRIAGCPLPARGSIRLLRSEEGRGHRAMASLELRPDGSFVARYLDAGSYRISAGVLGGGVAEDVDFTLHPGEIRHGLEIPWIANPAVEFRIRTGDGAPVPDPLFVSPRGGRGFRLLIDPDGSARTNELPSGTWWLQFVAGPFRAAQEVTISADGSPPIEVELEDPAKGASDGSGDGSGR